MAPEKSLEKSHVGDMDTGARREPLLAPAQELAAHYYSAGNASVVSKALLSLGRERQRPPRRAAPQRTRLLYEQRRWRTYLPPVLLFSLSVCLAVVGALLAVPSLLPGPPVGSAGVLAGYCLLAASVV